MKVKSLLKIASKCKTEEDASALLDRLIRTFKNENPVKRLPWYNEDYSMEDNNPSVKFELNHVISNYYITMIRPEIRGGKLTVLVSTNRMLDDLGIASKRWEVTQEMEDLIECDDESTITDIAFRAKQYALSNHTRLIEAVGVSSATAKEFAERSW